MRIAAPDFLKLSLRLLFQAQPNLNAHDVTEEKCTARPTHLHDPEIIDLISGRSADKLSRIQMHINCRCLRGLL